MVSDEARELGVVAEVMRVRVHDELTTKCLGALVCHLRRRGFRGRGIEERSIDLVHGDE